MEGNKKVIYIAGAITGVKNYWEEFDRYDDALRAMGYNTLVPSHLPKGLTNEQYMRICLAMIDSADAVVFTSTWQQSPGAVLEHHYCTYTDKPAITPPTGPDVKPWWLREALQEALGGGKV